ncbi:MAG: hypothetical protein ACFFHD_00390 [Promethearchaeota archaeon]
MKNAERVTFSFVSEPFVKEVLEINKANVSIGNHGGGCRGAGDFFVHKLIAELSETDYKAFFIPSSLDNVGAIRLSKTISLDY